MQMPGPDQTVMVTEQHERGRWLLPVQVTGVS